MTQICWVKTGIPLVIVSLLTLLIVGNDYREHWKFSQDHATVGHDATTWIPPLFTLQGHRGFAGNYVNDYFLSSLPYGYRLLGWTTKGLIDPTTLSRNLPYLIMLATAICVGIAVKPMAGMMASWLAMSLAMASPGIFYDAVGAIPRSFAFLFIAATAACLVRNRPVALALVCVLGALFYPVCIVISGATLGIWLMFYRWLPGTDDGQQGFVQSWPKRWMLLAGTGIVCVGLALPILIRTTHEYGPNILGTDDLELYPEAGPHGNNWYLQTKSSFPGVLAKTTVGTIFGRPLPWQQVDQRRQEKELLVPGLGLSGLTLMALVGLVVAIVQKGHIYRLGPLVLVMCLTFGAAELFHPYLYISQRYVRFILPILLVILVPYGLSQFCALWLGRLKPTAIAPGLYGLICASFFFLFGSLGGGIPAASGVNVATPELEEVFNAVQNLPEESLIAGWPDATSMTMEMLPFHGRRPVLLNYKSHLPLHRDYVLEMRQRMNALIDVFFGSNLDPILRLREEYGVTHLLIDKLLIHRNYFYYFAPYDQRIEKLRPLGASRQLWNHSVIQSAMIYQNRRYFLIELSRLETPNQSSVVNTPNKS